MCCHFAWNVWIDCAGFAGVGVTGSFEWEKQWGPPLRLDPILDDPAVSRLRQIAMLNSQVFLKLLPARQCWRMQTVSIHFLRAPSSALRCAEGSDVGLHQVLPLPLHQASR